MSDLELTPPPDRVVRKRVNKAPDARFKPDISHQIDPLLGAPEYVVPKTHLARAIKRQLEKLSFASVEARYSSQGQHGYHPRHLFGALVYGSLIGIHHSTKLASTLMTDFAARFVAGGHPISAGRLRAFKRENVELFEELLRQMLKIAHDEGLLVTDELAVDSVRLRAHASTAAVRTLKRSRKRLAQLAEVDLTTLSAEDLEEHQAKVEKHRTAVALCEEQETQNVVLTSPSAGLMKFPNGASAPGHRATVVAAGVQARFVVDVFVDGDGNDVAKLAPAVIRARQNLEKAGVPLELPMQVAADAGYFTATDLAFAAGNARWVDVLIAERSTTRPYDEEGRALFGVDDFTRDARGLSCPAQKPMHGPLKDGVRERWEGVGCGSCGLRTQCTSGTKRILTIDPEYHRVRDAMRARMAQPGAEERYAERIATVEPVFAALEDNMGYRRVTSRLEASVKAEVLLKVLAYNLKRLTEAKRLRRVRFLIDIARLPEASRDVEP